MAKYIDECITLLNDAFPDLWEQQFNLHISPSSTDTGSVEYIAWSADRVQKNQELQTWLAEHRDNVFEKLNCSVLTGEYAGQDNFLECLNKIGEALNIPLPGTIEVEVQEVINNSLKVNFIDCIKLAIEVYQDLYNQVKLRYKRNYKTYFTTVDFELNSKYAEKKFDMLSESNLNFFFVNVRIAFEDHFLAPDISNLRLLQEFENAINTDLTANKLSAPLLEKCKFLICKWILRKEEMTTQPVFAVKRGRVIELKIDDLNSKILEKWRDYIETHYLSGRKSNAKIKEDYSLSKDKVLAQCTLQDLHRKIKFYKDLQCDLRGLTKVRKELERRFQNASSATEHDRYVIAIAYQYALNNEFSLMLKENKHNAQKIDSFYSDIVGVQNSTGLQNFFPQYKYLDYLVRQLKQTFEQRNAFWTVKDSRAIIQRCETLFDNYQHNIEWSETNFNYVFLLPFNESFVEIGNEVLPQIFVASAFTLPLSKTIYKKEFEENRREYYTYKSSIEVFENLERDIKDTQKRELRSMEIIGIFTAIVTFIATSIPSFKFIETPYQAAIFMFALASSLGLFVLMIIISSRGVHKLREHWKIATLFLVLSVASWISLILWSGDPKGDAYLEKKVSRISDSIVKKQHENFIIETQKRDSVLIEKAIKKSRAVRNH